MASGQTTNYGLNQWMTEDKVLREEFNQDNAKLDSVISTLSAGSVRILIGNYTGNGQASQYINLSIEPKAILVFYDGYLNNSNLVYGGAAFPGVPGIAISISGNGFIAKGDGSGSGMRPMGNVMGSIYHYLVLD